MRVIKFKKLNGIKLDNDFSHEGLFHKWGVNYEEFESGSGNYTVAIVELSDGTIEEVLPCHIKFDDKLSF